MDRIIDFFAQIDRKNSIINLTMFIIIPVILIFDCILYKKGMAGNINGNISVNGLILLTVCVSVVCVSGAIMTWLGIRKQKEAKCSWKVKRKGERV